jgi:hypothetical protein
LLTSRQLADIDRDGCLIFEEFLIAMYLIDAKLKLNIHIPDSVPLALIESIKATGSHPTQPQPHSPRQQQALLQQQQQQALKQQQAQAHPQPTPTNPYATMPSQPPQKPPLVNPAHTIPNTNAPPPHPVHTNANPTATQQSQGFQFFTVEDIEAHKKLFDPLVNMSTGFKLGGQQALQFFSQAGMMRLNE